MKTKREIYQRWRNFLKLKMEYKQPGADLEDGYQRKMGFIEGALTTLKWILEKENHS